MLVLGIGNTNCGDDGVGSVLAARLAHGELGADRRVNVVDGGTVGLGLLFLLEDCSELLVVDAVDLGAAPGEMFVFGCQDLESPDLKQQVSFHQSGLRDLLGAARLTGLLPPAVTVIGIQIGSVRYGFGLSQELEQRLPAIERDIQDWVKSRMDRQCTSYR